MKSIVTLAKLAAQEIDKGRRKIYLGAAVGAAVAFAPSFHHEHEKLGQIPLAFSEIGNTRRCIHKYPLFQKTALCGNMEQRYGHLSQIPPLTNFYSAVNDSAMMVFEANNIARSEWLTSDKFAYELDKNINHGIRVHHQIPEYAAEIVQLSARARDSLSPLIKARSDISPAVDALNATWDEDHIDNYHTEIRSSTSCDSKGNCTTTSTPVQVYDNTTHYYTYHPDQGLAASRYLNDFLARNPDIHIREKLVKVWATGAENEEALRNSRKLTLGGKEPSDQDYLDWANKWATGSSFSINAPKAYKEYDNTKGLSAQWQQAARSAQSVTYTTGSHSDAGPEEYQISMAALENAQEMSRDIGNIEDGINYAEKNLPKLSSDAMQLVNAKLHHIGNTGVSDNTVISEAKSLYNSNMPGGFNVDPANWWAVAAWTILGTLTGVGVGFGVDYLRGKDPLSPVDFDYADDRYSSNRSRRSSGNMHGRFDR